MTRLVTTISRPALLLGSLGATVRGLGKLVAASGLDVSGLEDLERETARLRSYGRHWLM